MKTLLVAILIGTSSAVADQVVDPPLTSDTLVGVWERLDGNNPPTLWRMEINETGKSYLAQITVGTRCILRQLTFSEVKEGKIRLHFEAPPGEDSPDIWINGYGEGIASRGCIDWDLGNASCHFVKGSWTRKLAEASKEAEESIRTKSAK